VTIAKHRTSPEPALAPALVERVLERLGLREKPTLDLEGLNQLYAAFCGNVGFDNVQMRIWIAGPQKTPLPGGDPNEFFNDFLQHGTGGICWPLNGALYALARVLGFKARRIAGSVVVKGYPPGVNHGSVLVSLDRVNYLLDGWMASFKALPLVPGEPASTGRGIHDIWAIPSESGFEILSVPGYDRGHPLPFCPEPQYDPVDHTFFLARADSTRTVGFFNDVLFISRHCPDSILTLGRKSKFLVAADGTLTRTELPEAGRKTVLIEEFALSEEIVDAIPPNLPGVTAPFRP
jgi:N-hydroxyarylamine O-acetyltransferase